MSGFFGPDPGPGEPGGSSPFDEFLANYLGGDRVRRVEITRLMTNQARELLGQAARQATERGQRDLDAVHLLLAAASTEPGRTLLAGAGADPDSLSSHIEGEIPGGAPATGAAPTAPALTPAAKRVLLEAHQVSRATGSSYVGPDHLLFALAANPESMAGQLLAAAQFDAQSLAANAGGTSTQPGRNQHDSRSGTSATPTVDSYGQDLTAKASDGGLDPVVGRQTEIEQTIEVLARRTKNNPVLIGDAGVGKTAIVEGIAARIADGDVPEVLAARRVVQLELSGMLAGTRYRGDFEERMQKLVTEVAEHSDEMIVFIDELHTVIGAGGAEGSVDAGNILKPRLARGELHIVGATTAEEYRKSIEKDPAFERRFQPITVAEPPESDAVAILCGLRDRYEAHHQVRFTEEAIEAAVRLSTRYITDRFLPDKAIDLLDQAGARMRLSMHTPTDGLREKEHELEDLVREKDEAVAAENYEQASTLRDRIGELEKRLADERSADGAKRGHGGGGVPEVGADDIAEVVARSTSIPVAQLTEAERARLERLEDELGERVIGQYDAVRAVAQAVRRNRVGVSEEGRPVGSFLFLGPTGVGKTELARALAATMFGDEDAMVRFDMSEFSERHTISRLVGAPPGYVGYEEAGQLTETVRRRPYTVVLLDEIEKAHPELANLLLGVLDDGRLTDGQGRTVNFANTMLIMTSNLGSDLISSRSGPLGFVSGAAESDEEGTRARMMGRLRENFRPEFLNRIDEIVIFQRLGTDELREITRLMLAGTTARLRERGIELDFDDEAVDLLAQRGYQPEFGARPLRRTIQREVGDRVADGLLAGDFSAGERVRVSVRDGELACESEALEPVAG